MKARGFYREFNLIHATSIRFQTCLYATETNGGGFFIALKRRTVSEGSAQVEMSLKDAMVIS
jgi:hypothetical protein